MNNSPYNILCDKMKFMNSVLKCCVVLLLFPAFSIANTTSAGTIKVVDGITATDYVKIIRPGFTKIIMGKPGDALFESDTIKTGSGVKTQLELFDQTIITLGPNSNVQLKGFLVDRMSARRNSVMRLLKGTARFFVEKLFRSKRNGEMQWKDSSVTIETMNAVAGIRGTDLFVTYEGNETEIAVIDGVVAVKSADPQKFREVYVGENQVSRTITGEDAGESVPLPSDRRDVLLKLITMKNPLSKVDMVGKKTLTYDASDIERDIAADVPLSKIIDNAVEAGMAITEVVDAMISVGANPATIVYTAIQEGYPQNDVVQAAIEAGALLPEVISVALSAGATESAVIAGAQNAGVPPGNIAGAIAGAMLIDPTNLNVIGDGPNGMTSVPPPVLLPIGIGFSGGGGTPSASPYKP